MQAMSSMNVDVVWNQFKKALKENEPLDVVDKIIEQNLLVLEQSFEPYGLTPLNYVCDRALTSEIRFDVIERLVERFPKALTMASNDGYLPLHNICRYNNGYLPLHRICCSDEAPLHLVQLFVSKFPDSIKAKTNDHDTPLHFAVCWCLSLNVIKFIYELYPEAALQQNTFDGSTPLHYVCSLELHEFKQETLKFLYAACPKAARMQNNYGLTPFHNSCDKKNETAVQFFLERDPALIVAVNEQDKFHKFLSKKNKFSFDEMKKAIRENSQIYECVQNAALALVGELVIKDEKFLSEIEPNVIAEHLAKILETRPITTLQQLHSPNTTEDIIRVCTKQKVYDDLETQIYTPTFQTLLKGYRNIIRIDQSGFLRDDPGNKAKYIAVLAATACVNDSSDDDDSEDDNNHHNKNEEDDDDGSNDYESDSNENNSDADNNGDDNNSEDDNNNNNNKDDNNNNNKDDNNYGNVPLLFQQLRANTLLCKRLS